MAPGKQKHKVVVARQIPSEGLSLLKEAADLDLIIYPEPEDKVCDREWLLKNIHGAEGVALTLTEKVDEEFLDKAGPSLKVVSTMSAGFDHIDIGALKKRNIRLGVTPDVLTDAVADLGVLLVLAAMRRAGEAIRLVQEDRWPVTPWSPEMLWGPSLSKATVGFLGFGRISQALLLRLLPFGISRAIYTTSPTWLPTFFLFRSLRTALPSLSSRRETDADEVFLARMKKTAVLVNIARGPIVDNKALEAALKEEKIWGAGLDVVEGEPNVKGSEGLGKLPRCVIFPDAAGKKGVKRSRSDLAADEPGEGLTSPLEHGAYFIRGDLHEDGK
ncbi:Formate/glycerate dehydrogenase catalytic domain-like protein [Atractiella rhizophila]|nr:Formate/glycerate dehydrogenase catalytic domain-like protein [Atractiella rhizophila]